jgi:hypothetical protein
MKKLLVTILFLMVSAAAFASNHAVLYMANVNTAVAIKLEYTNSTQNCSMSIGTAGVVSYINGSLDTLFGASGSIVWGSYNSNTLAYTIGGLVKTINDVARNNPATRFYKATIMDAAENDSIGILQPRQMVNLATNTYNIGFRGLLTAFAVDTCGFSQVRLKCIPGEKVVLLKVTAYGDTGVVNIYRGSTLIWQLSVPTANTPATIDFSTTIGGGIDFPYTYDGQGDCIVKDLPGWAPTEKDVNVNWVAPDYFAVWYKIVGVNAD